MLIFIWFKCKKNALPFKFKNFIVYQSVIGNVSLVKRLTFNMQHISNKETMVLKQNTFKHK